MANESAPKLVRGLSLLDATMIVVGSMIGSGIFITSAESSRLVGSPGWLLMAWALAGVLTITGALCCAELAAMWPRAGGQYVFLREAYGPSIGFLFGWGLFLIRNMVDEMHVSGDEHHHTVELVLRTDGGGSDGNDA